MTFSASRVDVVQGNGSRTVQSYLLYLEVQLNTAGFISEKYTEDTPKGK